MSHSYAQPDHKGILSRAASQPIQFQVGEIDKKQFRNFIAEIVKTPDKFVLHIFAPAFSVPAFQRMFVEKLQNRMYPPIIGYTKETAGHGAIYEKAPEMLIAWVWDQVAELDQAVSTTPPKP